MNSFLKSFLDLKLFDTEGNATTPSTTNPTTVISTSQGNGNKKFSYVIHLRQNDVSL